MRVSNEIIDILCRWHHATDDEVVYAKNALMPQDEHNIKFKVSDHPNIKDGVMYTEWIEVNVSNDGLHLCDIYINCETQQASYTFL